MSSSVTGLRNSELGFGLFSTVADLKKNAAASFKHAAASLKTYVETRSQTVVEIGGRVIHMSGPENVSNSHYKDHNTHIKTGVRVS